VKRIVFIAHKRDNEKELYLLRKVFSLKSLGKRSFT